MTDTPTRKPTRKRKAAPLLDYFKSDIQEVRENFKKITIRWKKDSKIPTIGGKWRRMDDGRIEAMYTRDELAKCLEVYEVITGENGIAPSPSRADKTPLSVPKKRPYSLRAKL